MREIDVQTWSNDIVIPRVMTPSQLHRDDNRTTALDYRLKHVVTCLLLQLLRSRYVITNDTIGNIAPGTVRQPVASDACCFLSGSWSLTLMLSHECVGGECSLCSIYLSSLGNSSPIVIADTYDLNWMTQWTTANWRLTSLSALPGNPTINTLYTLNLHWFLITIPIAYICGIGGVSLPTAICTNATILIDNQIHFDISILRYLREKNFEKNAYY